MPLFSPMARITAGVKKVCHGRSYDIKHAEVDALDKIKYKKNVPKKVDLFVIRLTKLGYLAESRPCLHCLRALKNSGLNIKHVYYSNSERKIIRELFSKMEDSPLTYISRGHRLEMQMKTQL